MSKHWHVIATITFPEPRQFTERADQDRAQAETIAAAHRAAMVVTKSRGVVSISECWLTESGHGSHANAHAQKD